MKTRFKKGQYVLYFGRTARIVSVNNDNTYDLEYWLGESTETGKYFQKSAKQENIKNH